MKKVEIDWTEAEPIVVLEGGIGLNDTERDIVDHLFKYRLYPVVLENLYEEPEKIIALKYIKPKTIMLSTTGTYRDELDHCIEMFKIADHLPDNVIIGIGEDALWSTIRHFRKIKPDMKFFTATSYGKDDFIIQEMGEYDLPKID